MQVCIGSKAISKGRLALFYTAASDFSERCLKLMMCGLGSRLGSFNKEKPGDVKFDRTFIRHGAANESRCQIELWERHRNSVSEVKKGGKKNMAGYFLLFGHSFCKSAQL